jgi:F-type H+-transporting ATPase subunit delta
LASETTGVAALAERYAAALFDLAEERRLLDEVAGDLRQLHAMLAARADLLRLVRSPILPRLEQGRAIAALAQQAQLSPLVRDFLAVVAKNRRLFVLSAMIEAYLARLALRRGEVGAAVTTAQPLSAAQLEALSEHLRHTVGRRVSIDARVDPRLIGGLVVKVGSRMIDGSIESRLRRLQLVMKGVG